MDTFPSSFASSQQPTKRKNRKGENNTEPSLSAFASASLEEDGNSVNSDTYLIVKIPEEEANENKTRPSSS